MISKGLSAGDVKNQADNSLHDNFRFYNHYWTNGATTGSDVTIFQKTLNFTYIDYLKLSYQCGEAVQIKVDIDGGNEYDNGTTGAAGPYDEYGTIDCTGMTGDLVLEVFIQSAGADRHIKYLSLFESEA